MNDPSLLLPTDFDHGKEDCLEIKPMDRSVKEYNMIQIQIIFSK